MTRKQQKNIEMGIEFESIQLYMIKVQFSRVRHWKIVYSDVGTLLKLMISYQIRSCSSGWSRSIGMPKSTSCPRLFTCPGVVQTAQSSSVQHSQGTFKLMGHSYSVVELYISTGASVKRQRLYCEPQNWCVPKMAKIEKTKARKINTFNRPLRVAPSILIKAFICGIELMERSGLKILKVLKDFRLEFLLSPGSQPMTEIITTNKSSQDQMSRMQEFL